MELLLLWKVKQYLKNVIIMKKFNLFSAIIAITLFASSCKNETSKVEHKANKEEVSSTQRSVGVLMENYAEVMSDMAMQKEVELGATNKWHHHYKVMELDAQPAPMMNRDTKYSFAILDGGGDVAITLPETDGRYMSLHVWNHNHVTYKVLYGPGRYLIPAVATSDFFVANVRIQVDSKDPEDVKKASKFQDMLKIDYLNNYNPKAFKATNWDMETFKPVHKHYVGIANKKGINGSMGTIYNPVPLEDKNRGVSIGTGLLPNKDANYITANYNAEKGKTYKATYQIPELLDPKLGFYSITIYGDDQRLKTDKGSTLSNKDIKLNPDGKSFNINYVFEDDFGKQDNELIIPTESFWINLRVYMPGESVIKGKYVLPVVKPVN